MHEPEQLNPSPWKPRLQTQTGTGPPFSWQNALGPHDGTQAVGAAEIEITHRQ